MADAIAEGLREGGWDADLCPLEAQSAARAQALFQPSDPHAVLGALDFDVRMRAVRAVVLAERRLHEETLAGSLAFEIATRARQAGVPCYAVTAENPLDSFDARILDLQTIIVARSAGALETAGGALARLV